MTSFIDMAIVPPPPRFVDLILVTDADEPDRLEPHWRGFFGGRTATGKADEVIGELVPAMFDAEAKYAFRLNDILVLTGRAAEEYLIMHGDPMSGDRPLGVMSAT